MRLLCLTVVLLVVACGPAGDEPTPDVFIALQKDFAGFHEWEKKALDDVAGGDVHTAGQRVIYLNRRPASGSTQFPVGTIIVKTINEGTDMPGKTFAMAKRGGGFNSAGASGWEWFELEPGSDGTPVILWRGIAPPVGESYGGPVTGGSCNSCHSGSSTNDFVSDTYLRLSTF